jgi:hypothetical protein
MRHEEQQRSRKKDNEDTDEHDSKRRTTRRHSFLAARATHYHSPLFVLCFWIHHEEGRNCYGDDRKHEYD